MCTPATSFTFSGDVTVNGKTTRYTGQALPFPAGFTNCYSLQGNKLTITTGTPSGSKIVNQLKDVNSHITGTMKFPNATVKLDGTGHFN